MKAQPRSMGTAQAVVIKGRGADAPQPIQNINDAGELRRIGQARNIAFSASATVATMKKRLMEG